MYHQKMVHIVQALYDGHALHPQEPLPFPPNTRLRVAVEEAREPQSASFVDVVGNLNLEGPADWSENLEDYLYGRRDVDSSR